MRMRLAFAAAYGLAAIIVSGFADAMPPRAFDESVGGQLEIESPFGFTALEVLRTDIDADVRAGIAEIRLHQVFAGLKAAGPATYLLPLAEGVELLEMEVSEGARTHRKRFADEAIAQLSEPSMFEQDLRLFGAGPVAITMVWRQPVEVASGIWRLALPLARLPGGAVETAIWEEPGLEGYSDLPEYLCGEDMLPDALSAEQVDVTVRLDQTALREIYSDTHAIDVTAVDGGRVIGLAPTPVANRTFVLSWVPAEQPMTVVAQAVEEQ